MNCVVPILHFLHSLLLHHRNHLQSLQRYISYNLLPTRMLCFLLLLSHPQQLLPLQREIRLSQVQNIHAAIRNHQVSTILTYSNEKSILGSPDQIAKYLKLAILLTFHTPIERIIQALGVPQTSLAVTLTS